MRALLGDQLAGQFAGPSAIDGPAVLRAAVGPTINVLRWASLGYGLVAVGPHRGDTQWIDVILLGACVFLTTLRTLMPLRLGDRRIPHRWVPLFDVAVFSVAAGWTGATESPWFVCVMTALGIAAFGWGTRGAFTGGVIAISLVVIFNEVDGADITSLATEELDLLAAISMALAAAAGIFLRSRTLQAARTARRESSELSTLRSANDLLGELTEVALTLPGSFTLREALGRTRALLQEHLAPATTVLLVLDEHSDEWVPRITDGCAMRAAYAIEELPAPLAAVASGRTRLLVQPDAPGSVWLGAGSRSGLYLALRARDRAVGLLAVEHPDPDHFADVDPMMRAGLTDAIALTIDNARWFGRLRTLGAEEERIRVARDIHDRLGQWMTYIKLELERISASGDVDQMELVRLQEDAATALEELRETLRQMRTGVSDDRPLAVLGEDLVTRFAERTSVAAEFRVTHPGERLPVPVENELLRILQEALNNVDRHAKAEHVEVDWTVEGGNYELRVADDGRGFDPERAVHEQSYGVVGMRERAEVIGASFRLTSHPGEGTLLRVGAGDLVDDGRRLSPTGEQR